MFLVPVPRASNVTEPSGTETAAPPQNAGSARLRLTLCDSGRVRSQGLVSYGVAVPPRIASGEAVAGGRIDHHGRSATRHSEAGQASHLVASRFEFVINGHGHICLNRKLIEARCVWE